MPKGKLVNSGLIQLGPDYPSGMTASTCCLVYQVGYQGGTSCTCVPEAGPTGQVMAIDPDVCCSKLRGDYLTEFSHYTSTSFSTVTGNYKAYVFRPLFYQAQLHYIQTIWAQNFTRSTTAGWCTLTGLCVAIEDGDILGIFDEAGTDQVFRCDSAHHGCNDICMMLCEPHTTTDLACFDQYKVSALIRNGGHTYGQDLTWEQNQCLNDNSSRRMPMIKGVTHTKPKSFSKSISLTFGGSNPDSISEYYRGGLNVPDHRPDVYRNTIPTSGTVDFSDYYGTQEFCFREDYDLQCVWKAFCENWCDVYLKAGSGATWYGGTPVPAVNAYGDTFLFDGMDNGAYTGNPLCANCMGTTAGNFRYPSGNNSNVFPYDYEWGPGHSDYQAGTPLSHMGTGTGTSTHMWREDNSTDSFSDGGGKMTILWRPTNTSCYHVIQTHYGTLYNGGTLHNTTVQACCFSSMAALTSFYDAQGSEYGLRWDEEDSNGTACHYTYTADGHTLCWIWFKGCTTGVTLNDGARHPASLIVKVPYANAIGIIHYGFWGHVLQGDGGFMETQGGGPVSTDNSGDYYGGFCPDGHLVDGWCSSRPCGSHCLNQYSGQETTDGYDFMPQRPAYKCDQIIHNSFTDWGTRYSTAYPSCLTPAVKVMTGIYFSPQWDDKWKKTTCDDASVRGTQASGRQSVCRGWYSTRRCGGMGYNLVRSLRLFYGGVHEPNNVESIETGHMRNFVIVGQYYSMGCGSTSIKNENHHDAHMLCTAKSALAHGFG